MAKYNKKIVENICEMICADSYTIVEICRTVGIAKDTYYHWLKTKSDFSDAIKNAENQFNELIITEAKKSLVKMIRGYTVQEKRTVTADTGKRDENEPIVKVKEHSVTDKHYQPVPAAVLFALSNRDPKNWVNNRTSNDQFNAGNDSLDDDKPATMKLPDGTEIEI